MGGPQGQDHGRSLDWVRGALACPSRPIAEPDATDGVFISIVYVKPIGSGHTSDFLEGPNRESKNRKKGGPPPFGFCGFAPNATRHPPYSRRQLFAKAAIAASRVAA